MSDYLQDAISRIQSERGWTEITILDLCLEYIANQQDDECFLDFLRQRAETEDELWELYKSEK